MNCAKCGAELSPGSAFCMVCGTLTEAPPTTASKAANAQPAAEAFTQIDGGAVIPQPRRARTAFYGRYGGRGNTVLPQPSSLSLSTPTSEASPTESALAPTIIAAPPAELPERGITAPPVPPPAVSKPTRNSPATTTLRSPRPLAGRVITLVGILALLTLLVSLSMLGYNAYKKGQVVTRATATADTRLDATATAAAQASATASAPLFIDPLTSNSNGWPQNGTTTFFADGQYHLHNPDPTMTLDAYYQGQIFDNFKAQVTVTAYTDANPNADTPYAYGLILRADPGTPADKYAFLVSPDGTYDFARHDAYGFLNNGWSDLSATPWASSSAIHTGKGATNTLMVIANDTTFTLFINGQEIEVVNDTYGGYSSGWIGLLVEGADMEAGFSNLQVSGPGA